MQSRKIRSFFVAQWVKDLALSLLWQEFDPWPGNFQMPWGQPKKKKKERKKVKAGTRGGTRK